MVFPLNENSKESKRHPTRTKSEFGKLANIKSAYKNQSCLCVLAMNWELK